jgi:alpha-D-ribose 1-methylphosphonate 5-triphosphate diphosphatase PhnM
MATYAARMMDAVSGGEGRYDFEAEEDLLSRTPVRVVRAFMDHVDRDIFPRVPVDYELNAAFANREHQVVTAMGSLIHDDDPPTPFLLMISAARR